MRTIPRWRISFLPPYTTTKKIEEEEEEEEEDDDDESRYNKLWLTSKNFPPFEYFILFKQCSLLFKFMRLLGHLKAVSKTMRDRTHSRIRSPSLTLSRLSPFSRSRVAFLARAYISYRRACTAVEERTPGTSARAPASSESLPAKLRLYSQRTANLVRHSNCLLETHERIVKVISNRYFRCGCEKELMGRSALFSRKQLPKLSLRMRARSPQLVRN